MSGCRNRCLAEHGNRIGALLLHVLVWSAPASARLLKLSLGLLALSPVVVPGLYRQAWAQVGGQGMTTLTWNPATTYTDGSPLVLSTQYIFQTTVQGGCLPDPLLNSACTDAGSVGPSASSAIITGLYNGNYWYVVVESDGNGIRSMPSNEASWVVDFPGNVLTPSPATGLAAN